MHLQKIANSWRVKGIHIYPRISFEKFLDRTCEKLKINKEGKKIYYIVKYDPNVLLDLEDDEDVKDLVLHSNEFACVYIVHSAREECVQEEMVGAKNSNCCISREALCDTKLLDGFASRCVEREVKPLESQYHRASVKPPIQVTYDRIKKKKKRGV